MSNNTPGSSGNDDRNSSDIAGVSGNPVHFDPAEILADRRHLRKRRVQHVSGPGCTGEEEESPSSASTSSIASQSAVSHNKLRKINTCQSTPVIRGKPESPTASAELSPTIDPVSINSPSLPASSNDSPSSYSSHERFGVPPFTSTGVNPSDGRVTRSRLRAMQAASVPSNNQSVGATAKSLFVQGKDKIAKKGRNFLKKNESKKKKEHARSLSEAEEGNFTAASVIVRMANSSSSSGSSSSSNTPEPTPGGSARTTPFELQGSTAAAVAANASRIMGLRGFTYQAPMSSGGPSSQPVTQPASNQTTSGLIMPRGASRASTFLGNLVPRMQHLLGGNSPNPAAEGQHSYVQSNSRYTSILEGLKSTNDIRQTEAANELAELLLMGNEESLPNLPIREIVNQLNALMQKENNLELILTAVRCITNMQEALPRAMPILLETVPTLLQKLKHIECIDIAEQTLIALEVMSRRNAKIILHAGGFADAVMHVDFFSMPSQRLVYQIAANCASYVNINDFGLVRSCLPDLIQKITFDDKRCCESICTFFYRLIEIFRNSSERLREIAGTNYEFLMKIQQLLMVQPATISSSTFVFLLKSVRLMCIRCSDVVGALIDLDFGRTLKFLLVGHDKDSLTVDITVRPTQHTREIVGLVGELLPPLPKIEIFEICQTIVAYAANHVSSVVIKREASTESAVSVAWQFEDESGDMINFEPNDVAALENKRTVGNTEFVLEIVGNACIVDLGQMKYNNPRTGFVGRLDRRTFSPDREEPSPERDANREKHNKQLLELIRIHFPILAEIGTATSCSNLRYEATKTMMRMIYAVESESELRLILNKLPLASYIFSTLSSNKGHAIIASALQLIHVLLDKLPRLYVPLFEAEGVFYMIQALMKKYKREDKPPKTEKKDNVKVINLRRGPIEVASPGNSQTVPPVDVPQVVEQPSSSVEPIVDVEATSDAAPPPKSQAASQSEVLPPHAMDDPTAIQGFSFATMLRNAGGPGFVSRPVPGNNTPFSMAQVNSVGLDAQRQANYMPLIYPSHLGQALQMEGLSIVNGLQQASQDLAFAMQQHHLANVYSPTAASLKKANGEKIAEFIVKEARFLLETYHGKENVYDIDKATLTELIRISKALNKITDIGMKPLEDLADLITKKEITAFQLNHSRLTTSLCHYLVDEGETREPPRAQRLRRFTAVFMNINGELRDNCRPLDVSGEMFAAFEKLVLKLVHAVGQLEQFQIKVTNLNGVFGGTSSGAANVGTVLRGSQALRFFQTHQIRCNLKRHPSCKTLREWRHGRGSIKVDPFTSVSAIEKYLIDRGVGSNVADSSSDNDEPSEDDSEVGSAELLGQPFTGKVEILIGEQLIPSDLSILQAICQYSLPQDDEQEGIPNSVWVMAHTLYFRVAQKTEDTSASSSKSKSKSKMGKKSSKNDKSSIFYTGIMPKRRNPLALYLKSALDVPLNDQCADSCALLRVLYGLNRYWYEIYDNGEIFPSTHEPILSPSAFYSSKLNAKVQRQLGDFLSVATQQIPKWTVNIVKAVPFLFPFDVRRNLLYCTAFGRERALMHIVTEGSDEHDNEATSRLIPRLERKKVAIKRSNLLADAVSTFHQMHSSKAQLEVNFDGEIGTGFGPTLEFYSTISKEIQKHNLGLWNGVPQKVKVTDDGDFDELLFNENGLYPQPLGKHVRSLCASASKNEGRVKRFDFVGRLLAQALLDSRMLDIPFSPVFFKWLLHDEDTMGVSDMHSADPVIYNSLRQIKNETNEETLKDLELYFTLPGDEQFELKKNGKNERVTTVNIREFIRLVTHWKLVEGVREEMLSLRHGFEQVIDPAMLKIFACEEMEQLFCGCTEGTSENDKIWSKSALQQAIRPDHGYTHESPQIVWLVDMLHEFSNQDRRRFLQFCTGSPRLPVGGFRGLHPPLTVVRKVAAFGASEGELPSAMTCYNFLKIPAYSSYEMFVERFHVALQFIYSFHLT